MIIKRTIYIIYIIFSLFCGFKIGHNFGRFCSNIAYLYMRGCEDYDLGVEIGGFFVIPLIILSVWASNELYTIITNKSNLSKFKHFLFVILGVATSFIFANKWERIAFRTFEQVQWFDNGNQERLVILIGYTVIALIGGWTANILVKKYLTKHSKGCQSNLVLGSVMTIKQTIYMILGLFHGLVIGYNCVEFYRNITYLYMRNMQNNYDLVMGSSIGSLFIIPHMRNMRNNYELLIGSGIGSLFIIPPIILSVWASNELYTVITNKSNLSKFKHFFLLYLEYLLVLYLLMDGKE